MSLSYPIKWVQYFDREVPVFTQNENGPCPLLAIANVLSLRNQLYVMPGATSLSQSRLISMVAERILDSPALSDAFPPPHPGSSDLNSAGSSNAAGSSSSAPSPSLECISHSTARAIHEADLRANISDCLDVLAQLATGIDVNVRFNAPDAFEATREVAVFDLLGIPLVHGWLVDPQDEELARVIGDRSYNELVQLMVSSMDEGAVAKLGSSKSFSLSQLSRSLSRSAPPRPNPTDAVGTSTEPAPAPDAPAAAVGSPSRHTPDTMPARPVSPPSCLNDHPTAPSQPAPGIATLPAPQDMIDFGSDDNRLVSTPADPPPAVVHLKALTSDPESQQDPAAGHQDLVAGIRQAQHPDPARVAPVPPSFEQPDGAGSHLAEQHQQRQQRQQQQQQQKPSEAVPLPDTALSGAPQDPAQGQAAGDLFQGLDCVDAPLGGADAPVGSMQGSSEPPSQAALDPGSGSSPAGPNPPRVGSGVSRYAQDIYGSLLFKDFVEANCSQLTVYGLACMLESCGENQTSVFFRNNHFNVLFRTGRYMYLLVTDQGYLSEPGVVWERLDAVDGDTQMCGPDFQRYQGSRGSQGGAPAQAPAAGTPVNGISAEDAAAIAAAACDPSAASQSDADMAMAIHLQEQEEAAARVARDEHHRQQQQQTPQQQQQQQQQQYQQQYQMSQQQGQRGTPAGAQAQYPQSNARQQQTRVAPTAQKPDNSCVVM
ncbi:MAG: hypothetical protein WDW36_009883 [Sanguina aurantia]